MYQKYFGNDTEAIKKVVLKCVLHVTVIASIYAEGFGIYLTLVLGYCWLR